jgi:REP element-mobilizing transposase RayT
MEAGAAVGYYHCLSRVVNREFVLKKEEKEQLVKWMRRYEAFCGVRVITYCVMSNHFHILVEVPQRPGQGQLPSDEELVALARKAQDSYGSGSLKQDLERFRERGQHRAAEALKERFFSRMWDVSWFMRLLKQRFTQWYNKRHERTGTLWEDRFKSVLVEGAGQALATMALYIDLNPVRAGLVQDPQEYRWCGYAEALGGRKEARSGLAVVVEAVNGRAVVAQRVVAEYRMLLFARGDQEEEGVQEDGRPRRLGVSAKRVQEVLAKKGRLSPWESVRCRVRYLNDGVVLGGREFVERYFRENRERFGKKRADGARAMRYVSLEGLFTVRDLQKAVIG